jgi:hypothetical protein
MQGICVHGSAMTPEAKDGQFYKGILGLLSHCNKWPRSERSTLQALINLGLF